MTVDAFIPEDAIDNSADLVFFLLLLIDQHKRAQLFPCIQDVFFIANGPADHSFHLIGDTFAQLIIFIDILVVMGQVLVLFDQHRVSILQFVDVLNHPFILVEHSTVL